MSAFYTPILLNKGSDLAYAFNFPNGAGGNANLTGYTVSAFDVDALLVGLTVTLTTAAVGLITIAFSWSAGLVVGGSYSFRFRVVDSSGFDDTSPEIFIQVR